MNKNCSMNSLGLEYLPWSEKSYAHCFCTRNHTPESLQTELKLKQLFFLNQQHTSEYICLSSTELLENENKDAADAMIVYNLEQTLNVALCLKTADCLPILIRGESIAAVVHSGWRGLEKQICSKVVKKIRSFSDEKLEILVGPAAGSEKYEFGEKEAQSIGSHARLFQGKLDMITTLKNELKLYDFLGLELIDSGVCTITSPEFCSVRRDGAETGRNLSFLVV